MRIAVVTLVQTSAPARPACFADDAAWRSWLVSAHEAGERIVRRVDENQRTPLRRTHYELLPTHRINFCAECTEAHQRRMREAGRCRPCDEFIKEQSYAAI